MDNSILNRTANWFRTVGTLYETSLKCEDTKIKQKDAQGQDNGTKPGQRIMGNISVKTENGVHTFSVYAQSLTSKGEPTKQWKMYSDMLDWNPQVNGDATKEPTLVNIEGSVAINDYVNQQGEVKSGLRWRVGRGNTKANPDEPRGTTLKATLFIAKIANEIRNEEETGRLEVTLYAAENNGVCFPISAIVDESMADDFTSCYEVGMTVPFEFELISRHIGGNANEGNKKKFGHAGKVSVNNGFDVPELMLVGGDDEIEEPDELTTEDENGNEIPTKTAWINPVAMKKAIKARAAMLEELKQNPPKKNEKPVGSALKAAKAKSNNGAKFGSKSSVSFDEEDTDEDLPF